MCTEVYFDSELIHCMREITSLSITEQLVLWESFTKSMQSLYEISCIPRYNTNFGLKLWVLALFIFHFTSFTARTKVIVLGGRDWDARLRGIYDLEHLPLL